MVLCVGVAAAARADGEPARATVVHAELVPAGARQADVVIKPSALEALARVGSKLSPPRERHARGVSTQLLRTGFHSGKDGGEVVIQTSAAVELEARPPVGKGKEGAVFLLRHCRAVRRTDRLPLDTRFFHSAVTRVSLRQRGADLEVMVALRAAVTPVTRKEAGPAGSWYWVLTFPDAAATPVATAAR